MTMTPQRLLSARLWLGAYYAENDKATTPGSCLVFDRDRMTCRDALVSYERVLALLEHWKTSVPCGTGEEIMRAWAQRLEDLERAMAGGTGA